MLNYLEDYIEYIAGIRDSQGKLSLVPASPIRLANYDVNFVDSLSRQTSAGTALTDKQFALADKLVHKYKKQLSTQGITLPDNLALRMPIRVVDRSNSIVLSEDGTELYLKFPYQPVLIDSLRQFSRISAGAVAFDGLKKHWSVSASVPNLVYMTHWANEHNFQIKFDVDALLQSLYEQCQYPLLKFDAGYGTYQIESNPGSLDVDYVNSLPNIIDVLITAGNWQIPVDDSVIQYAKQQGYSDQWIQWSMKKMLHIRPDNIDAADFFNWVNTANLWPVLWNSSDLADMEYLKNILGNDRVVNLVGRKLSKNSDPQKEKLVLFSPIFTQKNVKSYGILVTKQSILYKFKPQWSQSTNKIVYWGDKILSEIIT